MKNSVFYAFMAFGLLMHTVFAGPLLESKEDKSLVTGRASMLGRFEPIVNSVVVPLLVATGVVSLVRMVPGVVSSLPGMFGFAKRTGFEGGEQFPREFYDIMTALENGSIKYGQPVADPTAIQRQPVASASQNYQYQYQQYLQQAAQQQAAQQQAAQVAQAQAQSGQKTQATARQHQG